MPRIPLHPYVCDSEIAERLRQRDPPAKIKKLGDLHRLVWALERNGAVIDGISKRAVRIMGDELRSLPMNSQAFQEGLSLSRDPKLTAYATRADHHQAWCIFDLSALIQRWPLDVVSLRDVPDPAGLLGPTIANTFVPQCLRQTVAACLSQTTDRNRLISIGTAYFSWLEPYLRGAMGAEAPSLDWLQNERALSSFVVRGLFRHLALWWRTSTWDMWLNRLREWLTQQRTYLSSALSSAKNINDVERGAAEMDVFVLALIRECANAFALRTAATRRLDELAEAAFFTRFSSALDDSPSVTVFKGVREFEFSPFLSLVQPFGIDHDRFWDTFMKLAADDYWKLVAPGSRMAERSRVLLLLAFGAIVAKRKDNNDLREAVKRALEITMGQASNPTSPLSPKLMLLVREGGLQFPLS